MDVLEINSPIEPLVEDLINPDEPSFPFSKRGNKFSSDNDGQIQGMIFDYIYGNGAYKKALLYLKEYKIPKILFGEDEQSVTPMSQSPNASGEHSFVTESIASIETVLIPFNRKHSASKTSEGSIDDSKEVADYLMDILILTAEEEELPLPPE